MKLPSQQRVLHMLIFTGTLLLLLRFEVLGSLYTIHTQNSIHL